MVEIERIRTEEFVPSKPVTYVDHAHLLGLYEKLAFSANMVLVGPKGVGKTLSVQAFARKTECPIVTFDCSEDVRRSQLYGSYILRGDTSPFVLGPLPTAFEIANEVGQCILCMEEINALTPQMQKLLNPVTDFRRRIEVPEAGRVFELKDGAKLWFVGTMNTEVYGGVYTLNEDFKSRVRLLPIGYPDTAQEKQILKGTFKDSFTEDQYAKVIRLGKESRQEALSYVLSTRDLEQLMSDMLNAGIENALWILTGKFEEDDREAIRRRIQSIFNVNIAKDFKPA
jgi:MoxR-like ATPase